MKLRKVRAGYYTATVEGRTVEVEYVETHYGDRGWMALVDDEPATDWPRQTRREAVAVAERTLKLR